MKKIIQTKNAPAPLGPYNQAILTGSTLYISGQIAIEPISGDLISTSIEAETLQVMKNLEAVLKAANLTFNDVVKSSIFIKNMNDFTSINEVYGRFFNEATAPARETVEVSKLPKNVNIEISMIATTA
jgi:2-iminobutanoate/2-iminopropanoate deaminase